MQLDAKISIASHRGFVSSAILRNREFFFEQERPEYVFLSTDICLRDWRNKP